MADRPVIANLDFDSVKQDIINSFKSREEFADYEFTGSSLNLLMDILSYNTHYYSLASNFLLNESFLDSALLRKNVVSLAKRLNYTPYSVRSAYTTVTIGVTKQSPNDKVVVIPAGTPFTAAAGNASSTFYTTKDYVIQFTDADYIGTERTIDVVITEGVYRTQSFTATQNYTEFAHFSLGQSNIDTSTLNVAVNGGAYQKVLPEDETLFDLSGESSVYFIEEAREGETSLVFGNGITGKALRSGDKVYASYLVSSGTTGNGISSFSVSVSGRADARVKSVAGPAQGGGAQESIQSIKDNAPKWFQAQYRAVTTNDYEVMLKKKFSDIQAVSVYGGEDVGYPGKVFLCVKPKSADSLTDATKAIIKSTILSSSNVVTVRPEIVDPEIFRLALQTTVIYDKARLSSTRDVLKAKVMTMYEYMNKNYIGEFLSSFRESNFSRELKQLDTSIISSNTRVKMKADISVTNGFLNKYKYSFNNKMYHPEDGFLASKGGILSSSLFNREGRSYQSGFDEDGYGNIRLFDWIDNGKVYVNFTAGKIDYDNGIVEFLYDFQPNSDFSITLVPDSVDILAKQNVILEIDTSTSSVEVLEINETDIIKNINLSRSF